MTKVMQKSLKKIYESDSLYEKLYKKTFCPDIESHIKVNPDICRICIRKECTKFCPSQVFIWAKYDDKLIISYENCLECGACKMGCPYEAIKYTSPNAGYGVQN